MLHMFKDYVKENQIWDFEKANKFDIIKEMAEKLSETGNIKNKEEFIKEIIEREKDFTTGLGFNIAIPHTKIRDIDDFIIGIGRIKDGVPFDSLDDKPVNVIIMIAAPADKHKEYIKLLAQIVLFAKNRKNFNHLLNDSPEKLVKFLKSIK